MNRKIGFFLLLGISILGAATWMALQNFDVRGFSLSDRENILASSGRTNSFLFEINAGNYEFTLHHFQNGERVSEQMFPGPHRIETEGNVIEAFQVQERELITFSVSTINEELLTFNMNDSASAFNIIEKEGIESWSMMSFDSIDQRIRLDEEEAILMFVALNHNGKSRPHLQNILSNNFNLEESLEEFQDIPELFIITVRKAEH